MSSLAASSSAAPEFFPRPVALAHTLNSRGELGMFVNPYACSCVTCVDYIAERAPNAPPLCREEPREDSYSSLAESTVSGWFSPAPRQRAAMPPPELLLCRSETGVALGPSETNPSWAQGTGAGGSLGRTASYAEPTPTPPGLTQTPFGLRYTVTLGLPLAPPPVAALHRRETAAEPDEEESDSGASAESCPALPGLGPCSPEEESLLVRLSNLRLRLKERQDAVYSEDYRSHDEAAAQDWEWDDLDTKIDAIEGVLRAFGVVIREA
jgi:hypothetical protein